MLKRLLSRSKTTEPEIAQVATPAVDEVVVEELPASPFAAPKSAPAPVIKIKKKRKSSSLRASDIKDENGRSAEEIAAEANKDFDIMAVARRAADLPETSAPPPKPVEAAPDAVEAPVATPAPVAAPIAEPEPEMDDSDPGHIVLPGADLDAGTATQTSRDAYWTLWGESDAALIGYDTNPQSIGFPAWPATRQNFRLVRTKDSLIIASEGLSDPFGAFSSGGLTNGFEMEVFIEIPGWQEMRLKEVKATWAFAAIEHFARVTAQARGFGDKLDAHDLLSVDLPHGCAPASWVDPDYPEMVGGLINMAMSPGLDRMVDMPLSPVRVVPLTMITPEELEACVIGGEAERKSLANDLLTTGIGHRTQPDRVSLR